MEGGLHLEERDLSPTATTSLGVPTHISPFWALVFCLQNGTTVHSLASFPELPCEDPVETHVKAFHTRVRAVPDRGLLSSGRHRGQRLGRASPSPAAGGPSLAPSPAFGPGLSPLCPGTAASQPGRQGPAPRRPARPGPTEPPLPPLRAPAAKWRRRRRRSGIGTFPPRPQAFGAPPRRGHRPTRGIRAFPYLPAWSPERRASDWAGPGRGRRSPRPRPQAGRACAEGLSAGLASALGLGLGGQKGGGLVCVGGCGRGEKRGQRRFNKSFSREYFVGHLLGFEG